MCSLLIAYSMSITEYRNDLGFIYTVILTTTAPNAQVSPKNLTSITFDRICLTPVQIKNLQVNILNRHEKEYGWLGQKMRTLCEKVGSIVEDEKGGCFLVKQ